MNISTLYTIIYHSFFSEKFYRQVAYEWKGYAIKVLAVISILYALINTVTWIKNINNLHIDKSNIYSLVNKPKNVNEVFNSIIQQLPHIHIVNGKINIDETQPYHIKNYINDEDIGIINTSQNINLNDKNKPLFFVTQDEIYLRSVTGKYDKFLIKNFMNNEKEIIIDYDSIESLLRIIKANNGEIFLILLPIFTIEFFLINLIKIIFFSLIINIILNLNNRIPFQALIRLSIISTIPIIVLKILVNSLPGMLSITTRVSIFSIISILYFCFAVISVVPKKNNENKL